MAEKIVVKIKNGEVEVVKFGKGTTPFVILPGLSYDGFFGQADAVEAAYCDFSRDFTVYLVDRNKFPRDGCTLLDIADETVEALVELGIKKADFFGASLGGMVAQEMAIRYPELVAKLVLGSTLSRPNETSRRVLSRWISLSEAGKIDELVTDMNRTVFSPATLERYKSVFENMRIDVTDEKTARFIAYAKAAANCDVYENLGKIAAKTLAIGASDDRVTTFAALRETAEAIGCEIVEYKNYGHAVYDEAPDFKRVMLNFLK